MALLLFELLFTRMSLRWEKPPARLRHPTGRLPFITCEHLPDGNSASFIIQRKLWLMLVAYKKDIFNFTSSNHIFSKKITEFHCFMTGGQIWPHCKRSSFRIRCSLIMETFEFRVGQMERLRLRLTWFTPTRQGFVFSNLTRDVYAWDALTLCSRYEPST